MVKKLFKYEFKFYFRIMLPIYAIYLLVAAVGRIIQLFEDPFEKVRPLYMFLFGSSTAILALGSVAMLIGVFIIAVIRFYKSMYGGEGYLTFTLPVSETSHILTKLVTAVVFEVAAIAVILLGLSVFTAGEVFAEVLKAAGYIFSKVYDYVGAHMLLYILEIAVFLLVYAASAVLVYYMCITIGQLSNKSRVGMAVLAYFIYYIAVQIIGFIINIVITVVMQKASFEWLMNFIINNPKTFLHLVFCDAILLYAVIGFVYFTVVRRIVKNKLNLE